MWAGVIDDDFARRTRSSRDAKAAAVDVNVDRSLLAQLNVDRSLLT
jgi:hypothetical protein